MADYIYYCLDLLDVQHRTNIWLKSLHYLYYPNSTKNKYIASITRNARYKTWFQVILRQHNAHVINK